MVCLFIVTLVNYLTQVSDLDLAPDSDQFMASPTVRYINSGSCVHIFPKICYGQQRFLHTNTQLVPIFEFDYDGHICSLENFSMCLWTTYKGVLGRLKFDRGGCKNLKN